MGKFIDIIGFRYTRLLVVERIYRKNKNITYWKCVCDCGNETIVSKPNLTTGHTKSCGCFKKEVLKNHKYNVTHEESKTRLYHIWQSMKQRCYDKNTKEYKKYYGSKGVKVCEEWMDYIVFSNWSKDNGYRDDLTLDRIDNSGNYEPDNCRWATVKQQNRNKTTNVIIKYKGCEKCVSEWSEELNIPTTTIRNRMRRTDDSKIILNTNYKRERATTGNYG